MICARPDCKGLWAGGAPDGRLTHDPAGWEKGPVVYLRHGLPYRHCRCRVCGKQEWEFVEGAPPPPTAGDKIIRSE